MKWSFWRKENPVQSQLELVQKLLMNMNEQFADNSRQLSSMAENISATNEHLQKWSRYQYKSTQDIQSRLDKLEQSLGTVGRLQEENDVYQTKMVLFEERKDQVSEMLIQWLDDLDHLTSKLSEEENQNWLHMIQNWSKQLIIALAIFDIREMELLHSSFDPRFAEAVDTVPLESIQPGFDGALPLPFQITDIVRRGYIKGQQSVYRKAQVITLQYDGSES